MGGGKGGGGKGGGGKGGDSPPGDSPPGGSPRRTLLLWTPSDWAGESPLCSTSTGTSGATAAAAATTAVKVRTSRLKGSPTAAFASRCPRLWRTTRRRRDGRRNGRVRSSESSARQRRRHRLPRRGRVHRERIDGIVGGDRIWGHRRRSCEKSSSRCTASRGPGGRTRSARTSRTSGTPSRTTPPYGGRVAEGARTREEVTVDDPRVAAQLSASGGFDGCSDGVCRPPCAHCPRVAHTGRRVAGVGGREEGGNERRMDAELEAIWLHCHRYRTVGEPGRPGEPSLTLSVRTRRGLRAGGFDRWTSRTRVRRRFGSDRRVRKSKSTMRSRGAVDVVVTRKGRHAGRSRLCRFAFCTRRILLRPTTVPPAAVRMTPMRSHTCVGSANTGSIGLIPGNPISDSAASPKNV